jgi:hypothetical protein
MAKMMEVLQVVILFSLQYGPISPPFRTIPTTGSVGRVNVRS